MSKNKNSSLSLLLFQCISVISLAVLLLINNYFWIKFAIASVIASAICVVSVLSYVKQIKTHKKTLLKSGSLLKKTNNATDSDIIPTDRALSMLDIYALLGIAPQYNADGSIKDVYQLLQLRPEYDEKGKRILTIYERLGINPNFTANGVEVPYVLRIKNRVGSIAKLAQSTEPLIYYPRDKQIIGDKTPVLPVPPLVSEDGKPVIKDKKPAITIVKKTIKKPEAKKPAPVKYSSASPRSISIQQSGIKKPKVNVIELSASIVGTVKSIIEKPKKEPPAKKQEPPKPKETQVKVVLVTKEPTPPPSVVKVKIVANEDNKQKPGMPSASLREIKNPLIGAVSTHYGQKTKVNTNYGLNDNAHTERGDY